MTETKAGEETGTQKLLYLILFSLPMSAFTGLVCKCLYQWFVIPVFHTPYISVVQFMGLGVFRTFLMFKLKDENEDKTVFELYLQNVVIYLWLWGFGAVIHFWLM